MAQHCSKPSFMLNIALLLSLSIVGLAARPTAQLGQDLIASVCSKTINVSLCNRVFELDPRAPTADLKGLGVISVNNAKNDAEILSVILGVLVNGATDPELKARYTTCAGKYQNSRNLLAEAQKALNDGDFETVQTKASAASSAATTCEAQFVKPPAEDKVVKDENKVFPFLCNVVEVISDKLAGK